MQPSAMIAGILGISLILSVSIYVFARLRIEQERTVQKLIDRGVQGDELLRSAGLTDRGSKDLRRGLLLIAIGLAWSTVTFFAGGTAAMMAAAAFYLSPARVLTLPPITPEAVVATLLLAALCSFVWISTESRAPVRIRR